ncbi:Rho GTPase activation protein [Wilcoxina mikolae CBS 423.85]|nr:Rho GTPase activation protein [Wilcoxina mikolae CBS 423.85]
MGKKDHLTASTSSTSQQSNTNGCKSNGGGIRLVNEEHTTTAATKLGGAQDDICKKPESQPPIPPKDSTLLQQRSPVGNATMSSKTTDTSPSIPRIAEHSIPSPLKLALSSKEKSKRSKGIAKSAPSSRTPSASPPTIIPSSSQGRHRGTPSSPANEYSPALPPRPGGPRRSSSQDGNFLSKVKKGKEQVQAGGLKAVGFLDKVGHVAWDKLKSPARLNPKQAYGRSISPQNGYGRDKYEQYRDTSNDVDVFGMDLKEAVAKTRIVKDRKMGGDAAFWMPAIAYRCLQYLNVYGPHELGIYRISGSTSVVDDLRAEFKIRHDVDLFENPPDDLHTVSSLLKGWFRSLPDAILPLDVQKRIYDRCKDETESPRPPQAFIDELSNLPPYNYYLLNHLFSHLSTICLASDINKMNLSNLGMIFCSTLRIDRFCFNWLVNSWADCWAGCLTEEDEYIRTEQKRYPPSTSSSNCQQASSDSRTGRPTEESDDKTDRWPSASSREPTVSPSLPPATSKDSQDKEQDKNGEDQDIQKEWMERAAEKERERELERENTLESRTGTKTQSISSQTEDRFSTMVEANGSPRQSLGSSDGCGGLSVRMSLPPIQPISPLMKQGGI